MGINQPLTHEILEKLGMRVHSNSLINILQLVGMTRKELSQIEITGLTAGNCEKFPQVLQIMKVIYGMQELVMDSEGRITELGYLETYPSRSDSKSPTPDFSATYHKYWTYRSTGELWEFKKRRDIDGDGFCIVYDRAPKGHTIQPYISLALLRTEDHADYALKYISDNMYMVRQTCPVHGTERQVSIYSVAKDTETNESRATQVYCQHSYPPANHTDELKPSSVMSMMAGPGNSVHVTNTPEASTFRHKYTDDNDIEHTVIRDIKTGDVVESISTSTRTLKSPDGTIHTTVTRTTPLTTTTQHIKRNDTGVICSDTYVSERKSNYRSHTSISNVAHPTHHESKSYSSSWIEGEISKDQVLHHDRSQSMVLSYHIFDDDRPNEAILTITAADVKETISITKPLPDDVDVQALPYFVSYN